MQISEQEATQILRLRTLIARAAQVDSLKWWEDESLTDGGLYLLERIFWGSPSTTSRNLAHSAALHRHQSALKAQYGGIHLFQLSIDNIEEETLKSIVNYVTIDLEGLSPISDLEHLRHKLLEIIEAEPQYTIVNFSPLNHSLQILPLTSSGGILDYAYALSWAYLEGNMGQAVFPYILEKHHE